MPGYLNGLHVVAVVLGAIAVLLLLLLLSVMVGKVGVSVGAPTTLVTGRCQGRQAAAMRMLRGPGRVLGTSVMQRHELLLLVMGRRRSSLLVVVSLRLLLLLRLLLVLVVVSVGRAAPGVLVGAGIGHRLLLLLAMMMLGRGSLLGWQVLRDVVARGGGRGVGCRG